MSIRNRLLRSLMFIAGYGSAGFLLVGCGILGYRVQRWEALTWGLVVMLLLYAVQVMLKSNDRLRNTLNHVTEALTEIAHPGILERETSEPDPETRSHD